MLPQLSHKDTTPTCVADVPDKIPARDLSFYAALVFLVLPVWSVVPISWIHVVYALHTGAVWTFSRAQMTCFVLALAEVFFSLYHFNLARFVAGPCTIPASDPVELHTAFQRVTNAGPSSLPEDAFDEETMDASRPGSPAEAVEKFDPHDPRAVDFRNSLRTWFHKVPWSHIRKQEMYQWLYWCIFNVHLPPLSTLSPARRTVLEDVFSLVEKRSGTAIPPGTNPAVRPILLTLDPVRITWRPLAWYVLVTLVNSALRTWLVRRRGMRHGAKDGIEYLLYVPDGYALETGPAPVVFVHGLGLGLIQYQMIVLGLLHELHDRPILVPLQPHVSQQIFHPAFLAPQGRRETAAALHALLVELGWAPADEPGAKAREGRITLMSHSNGSFVHAWLLKAHPELFRRSCFVDPVTFCSWEGDVCYNFIHRPCSTGVHLLMRYFVSTELGVANVLQRHFDWVSNSLWYEEIPHPRDPRRSKFFLGGSDTILAAPRVQRYLASHGVRDGLWYDPAGHHGQAIFPGSAGYRELIGWLTEAEAEPAPVRAR